MLKKLAMKKILFFLSIILLSLNINGQAFNTRDSTYKWAWNDTISDWEFLSKEIYTYNIDSTVLGTFRYQWNNNQWIPITWDSIHFSPTLGTTYYNQQNWDGSNWVNGSQFFYTYDTLGHLVNANRQVWINNSWENILNYIFGYDPSGNLNLLWTQDWDSLSWINNYKILSVFDSAGNSIEEITQHWVDTAFVNFYRIERAFGSNHFQTFQLNQMWDSLVWENLQMVNSADDTINNIITYDYKLWNGSIWENFQYIVANYDSLHRTTSSITDDWDGMNWVHSIQGTNEFDSTSIYPVSYLNQNWDGTNWVNQLNILKTYTGINLIQSEVRKTWYNSSWLNEDSTRYYYSNVLTGINNPEYTSEILLFPNPAGDHISITTLSRDEIIGIQIFNTMGSEVYSKKLLSQKNISLDLNLESGLYFVVIKLDEKNVVKRLIVR